MKINKLIGIMLCFILMASFGAATVTQTLNAPASYFETSTSTVTFNWTGVSDKNTTIDNWIQIYNGTDWVINMTHLGAANNTAVTNATTFAIGYHKWRLVSYDVDGNVTSGSRWFEVRGAVNYSNYIWDSSTLGNIMTLSKDTGDLWVYGFLNSTLAYFTDLVVTGLNVTTLTLANDNWMRSTDNAGTGHVNMFKLSTSDEIDVGTTLNVGPIELVEDSGAVTLINLPVSSTPSNGDEMSYVFSIDSNPVLKIYGEADGTGGADTTQVHINDLLKLNPIASPPTASEGMIYADTDHHLYYYNSTDWVVIG